MLEMLCEMNGTTHRFEGLIRKAKVPETHRVQEMGLNARILCVVQTEEGMFFRIVSLDAFCEGFVGLEPPAHEVEGSSQGRSARDQSRLVPLLLGQPDKLVCGGV